MNTEDYFRTDAQLPIQDRELVILAVAIAFSKRKVTSMDEGGVESAAISDAVHDGDPPLKLAVDALDRWMYDLGEEEHELRAQLRQAKQELLAGSTSPASSTAAKAAVTRTRE